MKRIIAILFTGFFVLSLALSAYAVDFDASVYSENELREIVSLSRFELLKYDILTEENKVLLDSKGVKITILDNRHEIDSYWLRINVIIENNTKENIEFFINDVSINGWVVEGYILDDIPSGKKLKGQLLFREMKDAYISNIEDIEDIEFYIEVNSKDTYKTLFNSDVLHIQLPE